MKPYYSDDAVTIYHAGCMDVLPTLSDVGMVLTSPPYNLSEGGRKPSGSGWKRLDEGYASYSDDMPHDQYVAWQRSVLSACWSALASDGAIYYQHKGFLTVMVCFGDYEVFIEDVFYKPGEEDAAWDYAEAVCTILIGTIRSANQPLPSGQRKEAA